MTSIVQLGSSLGSCPTFSSPNPHYHPTFGSFDFVSSPVWWEAKTNISLISHWLVLTLHIKTMASPIGYRLSLEDPDFVDTWLWCFAASARTKMLKDDREKGGENEITELFLANAGCEAIMKVSTMAYAINLEDLTFEKISQIIRRNIGAKKSCSWQKERSSYRWNKKLTNQS